MIKILEIKRKRGKEVEEISEHGKSAINVSGIY